MARRWGSIIGMSMICLGIILGSVYAFEPDGEAVGITGETQPVADVSGDLSMRMGRHQGSYLTEVFPEPVLTETAREAVQAAPVWLQEDLVIAFSRFDETNQDRYANKILHPAEARYRDEIAFCVAHMLTSDLTRGVFDDRLLDVNARWLYLIDESLSYVRLVDYGDPTSGGTDYYTTAAYIIDEGAGPFEVEIPREYYYWWVVHPVLSDEKPGFINPSTAAMAAPEDGGYFWRQYLWESGDDYDYTSNLFECYSMEEVLPGITYLWDRGEHPELEPDRPWDPNTFALDVIGHWGTNVVHWGATQPRPVQPVAIAYDHDGNCGEFQDILSAAARTALIPANCTSTFVDDHVWVEFWENGWHPYQDDVATRINVYTVAMDSTYGGGKEISAAWSWRGDDYEINHTSFYTNTARIVTTVTDRAGVPLDGALVKILGQSYYNPNNFYTCIEGCTDMNGRLELDLGDNRDFKGQVFSHIGAYGDTDPIMIVEDTVAGESYSFDVSIDGLIGAPEVTDGGAPPSDKPYWRLSVEVDVPFATQFWLHKGPQGDLVETARRRESPGSVDFFLCDQEAIKKFYADEPFSGYEYRHNVSELDIEPSMNDGFWTAVISNKHRHGYRQVVDVIYVLEQNVGGTWTQVDSVERRVYLEPGTYYTVSFGEPYFDLDLRMPAHTFSQGDTCSVDLDMNNPSGSDISADVYALLEVYGVFYAYPSWQPIEMGLEATSVTVVAGGSGTMELIPAFEMPEVGDAGPFYFYAAAFEPGTLDGATLISDVPVWDFYLAGP